MCALSLAHWGGGGRGGEAAPESELRATRFLAFSLPHCEIARVCVCVVRGNHDEITTVATPTATSPARPDLVGRVHAVALRAELVARLDLRPSKPARRAAMAPRPDPQWQHTW